MVLLLHLNDGLVSILSGNPTDVSDFLFFLS